MTATFFIYTSVAGGFNTYNAAVTTIRTQHEVLIDLLNEDTAVNGYFNTHESLFIDQYMKIAVKTPQDIRLLGIAADATGLPVTALIVDSLKESYFQYTFDVRHLFAQARVSDSDQEIPRKLQVAMRSDLQDPGVHEGAARLDDRKRALHGLGRFGRLTAGRDLAGRRRDRGDIARRREQRELAVQLDARNRELERSNTALEDFAASRRTHRKSLCAPSRATPNAR